VIEFDSVTAFLFGTTDGWDSTDWLIAFDSESRRLNESLCKLQADASPCWGRWTRVQRELGYSFNP